MGHAGTLRQEVRAVAMAIAGRSLVRSPVGALESRRRGNSKPGTWTAAWTGSAGKAWREGVFSIDATSERSTRSYTGGRHGSLAAGHPAIRAVRGPRQRPPSAAPPLAQ